MELSGISVYTESIKLRMEAGSLAEEADQILHREIK